MKIAVLGTRGIPNHYGGFEQCAEKLSPLWVKRGISVDVFCEVKGKLKVNRWKDVDLVAIPDLSNISGLNVVIYDCLSILKVLTKNYNIILQLGYSPAALFYPLLKLKNVKIITNMAGIEWKRSKWGLFARTIIKLCEHMAVHLSDIVVADNIGIKEYLDNKYKIESRLIAYGAEPAPISKKGLLDNYQLYPNEFYMLIARLQPDNNIEMILDGYQLSNSKLPFIVIGGPLGKYADHLHAKYAIDKNIKFLGGIYDYSILCTLRSQARLYFHGHSAGGTNPSLLEAMESGAKIAAYDNIFNRSVLDDGALFFKNENDIVAIIHQELYTDYSTKIRYNKNKIKKQYTWTKIAEQYQKLFVE